MTARGLAGIGAGAWVLGFLFARPSPWDEAFARWLLVFAPAAILPLWLGGPAPLVATGYARVVARPRVRVGLWVLAVAALVLANLLERGALAAAACLPWGGLLCAVCLGELRAVHRNLRAPVASEVAELAAPFFGLVGVAWTAFDRVGLRPLDLPAEIVLLTAIHFHYAGIVLPLVVGWVERGTSGRAAWASTLVALGGVPLVALGITATQIGAPPTVESLCALAMSLGGAWVAWRLARHALRLPPATRALGLVAALCLAAAMVLAAAYATRHQLEFAWLSIPWMRGVHGSLNALGFAAGASLAAACAGSRAP